MSKTFLPEKANTDGSKRTREDLPTPPYWLPILITLHLSSNRLASCSNSSTISSIMKVPPFFMCNFSNLHIYICVNLYA